VKKAAQRVVSSSDRLDLVSCSIVTPVSHCGPLF
jgi:hypothetical protein